MNNNDNKENMLHSALSAAATHGDNWRAGKAAFQESHWQDPGNNDSAFRAALDAAATEDGRWEMGALALATNGGPTLSRTPDTRSRTEKVAARLRDATNKAKDKPFINWRAYFFGFLVICLAFVASIYVAYTINHTASLLALQDAQFWICLFVFAIVAGFGLMFVSHWNSKAKAKKSQAATTATT
jgi:hypothetical protein